MLHRRIHRPRRRRLSSVCPSVRLSVTSRYYAKTNACRITRLSPSRSPRTETHFHTLDPRGTPCEDFKRDWVGKRGEKGGFSTNKSLYRGNDRRQAYSYNGILIGSRIWVFDWYQISMSITLNELVRTQNLTRGSLCSSEWRQTHPLPAKDSAGSVDFSDVQIVR